MGFFGQGMNPARVNPAVIEIEQRAYRDGEVDRLVVPAGVVKRNHIVSGDTRRIMIHLRDKAEQRFVFLVERRRFQIVNHSLHQLLALQQFRRNCGVRLQSKRAVVLVGNIRRDQFTNPRA